MYCYNVHPTKHILQNPLQTNLKQLKINQQKTKKKIKTHKKPHKLQNQNKHEPEKQ